MKKISVLFLFLIVIVNAQTDNTPPVIKSISFDPDTINTIDTSATILIKAVINDDLSGVRRMYISFRSPSENNNVAANIYSTNNDTIASNGDHTLQGLSGAFAQYSEAGDWNVNFIAVYDSVGNVKYYNNS